MGGGPAYQKRRVHRSGKDTLQFVQQPNGVLRRRPTAPRRSPKQFDLRLQVRHGNTFNFDSRTPDHHRGSIQPVADCSDLHREQRPVNRHGLEKPDTDLQLHRHAFPIDSVSDGSAHRSDLRLCTTNNPQGDLTIFHRRRGQNQHLSSMIPTTRSRRQWTR